MPPTLKALLAARLDQLEPAERRVLERGAVEGEVFHRGAVQALAPEEPQVTPRLAALVRQELIRPDRAQFPGEDGFRFRHLLIRDAAYDALPKACERSCTSALPIGSNTRRELVELDEIVGYHLEQGARYKPSWVGPIRRSRYARRTARRRRPWRSSARRPSGRRPAARTRLELSRPVRLDVMLELDRASAISYRDGPGAVALSAGIVERAMSTGDATGELLARVGVGFYRMLYEADPDVDEVERLAREALTAFEKADDHAALAYVWFVLGFGVANFRGRYDDWFPRRTARTPPRAASSDAAHWDSSPRPRAPLRPHARPMRHCAPSTSCYRRTRIRGPSSAAPGY